MTAPTAGGFHHRSSLKQKNKKFKGTTKAKNASSRGKVDRKTLINQVTGVSSMSKNDRRNHNKMKQATRKATLEEQKKIFIGPGGVARTIAIIPLTPSADVLALRKALVRDESSNGQVYFEHFKQNVRFFCPDRNNFLEAIDASASVDTILFLVSAKDECVDQVGVDLLEVFRAQGLCTAVACIQDLESIKPAKQHDLRTSWLTSLTFHLASTLHQRLFSFDHFESKRESAEMMRIICQLPIYDGISWREVRPYVVAESIEVIEPGTLKLVGRIRGTRALDVNQLLHISGIGDFQMKRLTLLPLRRRGTQMDIDSPISVVPDLSRQESLFDPSCLPVDENDTQITQNVLGSAENEKLLVKVPKGTSAYQARIIYEAGLEESESSESEDDEGSVMEEKAPLELSDDDESETEFLDLNAAEAAEEDTVKRRDLEAREAEQISEDYSALKREQLQSNEPLSKHFPDAVEAPDDESARVRYAKYRGVQSLRTSEWDVECDQIPAYFSAISQFGNFKLSMKRALNPVEGEEQSPFQPGCRVEIEISLTAFYDQAALMSKVSAFLQNPLQAPFTVYGLLPHENKYSILNFSVQSKLLPGQPIPRSKQPVLMISGFRRLEVAPIYSDASSALSLHPLHRNFPTDRPCIASFIAPIAYPPMPIMLFQAGKSANSVALFASGSLESVKPNRICLKRISFIGYPFKIHRRTATVRFMFFNPADVNWFKPVELVSSHQHRRGHIKESLGTHGYMKCIFDKQIQQNEQIAMHLYKRIFPKWNTRVCSTESLKIDNSTEQDNDIEMK